MNQSNHCFEVPIEIGEIGLALATSDSNFAEALKARYAGYLSERAPEPRIDIQIRECGSEADSELQVRRSRGCWHITRGDFHATWDGRRREGKVIQTANPFAIDSALRIVHSLILSESQGFLIHAASAVRAGRASLFAGQSGAGKTTLSRMAPPDISVLSDEISYVRKIDGVYLAFGTPFTGELGMPGENISAPLAAWHVLIQGDRHELQPIASSPEAVRLLMQNILFFAEEHELVERVFDTVCDFVANIRGYKMIFKKEPSAWELVP